MRNFSTALALTIVGVLAYPLVASAQQVPALATVVATCGTPPNTYTAGDNRPLTQDTTGKGCENVTVNATVTASTPGALTEAATGAITSGGTSQQVFAASAARLYLSCQNIDASEDMWVRYGASAAAANAAGSWLIKAGGGSITFEGSFIDNQAVQIIAATTGHKFTCVQG